MLFMPVPVCVSVPMKRFCRGACSFIQAGQAIGRRECRRLVVVRFFLCVLGNRDVSVRPFVARPRADVVRV